MGSPVLFPFQRLCIRKEPVVGGSKRSSVLLSSAVSCKPSTWSKLRRVLCRVLKDHEVLGTLSLALVSDEEIRNVHRDFLGVDTPTDVISFPLKSSEGFEHDDVLGQVVVSVDTARREARLRRLPLDREVALYAIHGTLHLVGYDDLESAKKRVMRRAERHYLCIYDELKSQSRSSRRPEAPRPRKKQRPARA